MAKDILETFFEDLLSGTGAANSVARERARAAILPNPQTDDAALADIAAHLDAAPDSGGDAAFMAKLADDPDVLHEVESAQDFVERVNREAEPVPARLLRLVGAAPAAKRIVRLDVTPSRQISLRRKPILLWGGAIAAMVVAGMTGFAIRGAIERGNAPLAFVSTGNPEQNAVAILQPSPEDAFNNSAPPVYGVVNPPIPVSSHAVGAGDYPPESVQFQEQGTVKVKYLVLKNGTVGNCQVEISSGFARLDDAACVLVRQWLFKPASVKDGNAVDWWLDASIVYQLRSGGLSPAPELKNAAPPSAPPIPLTSHAVTADDYPPVSIRLQEQGKVDVKYRVMEDGSVGDCVVIRSSGKTRLDDAACTMVKRRWKFKPATRNGQPVGEYLTGQIIFQLK